MTCFLEVKAQGPFTKSCDCYQRLNQLSSYYTSQGEHKRSLEVFRHALSFIETIKPSQSYYLATLLAANGECVLAKEYLRMAIVKGHDLTYIPYDENLPTCLATSGKEWEKFTSRSKKYHY